jgi:hypothetical protein
MVAVIVLTRLSISGEIQKQQAKNSVNAIPVFMENCSEYPLFFTPNTIFIRSYFYAAN